MEIGFWKSDIFLLTALEQNYSEEECKEKFDISIEEANKKIKTLYHINHSHFKEDSISSEHEENFKSEICRYFDETEFDNLKNEDLEKWAQEVYSISYENSYPVYLKIEEESLKQLFSFFY